MKKASSSLLRRSSKLQKPDRPAPEDPKVQQQPAPGPTPQLPLAS